MALGRPTVRVDSIAALDQSTHGVRYRHVHSARLYRLEGYPAASASDPTTQFSCDAHLDVQSTLKPPPFQGLLVPTSFIYLARKDSARTSMITEHQVNEVITLDGPEGHESRMTLAPAIKRAGITRLRDIPIIMSLPGFAMNDFLHRSAAISYPFTRIAKPFFSVDPMVFEILDYDEATDRHFIDGMLATLSKEDMDPFRHVVSLHEYMPVIFSAEAMPCGNPRRGHLPHPGPPTRAQEAHFMALLQIQEGVRPRPKRRRRSG